MPQVPERFAHLSNNNNPPTSSEVADLRKELVTRGEALVYHQREINRLVAECQAYAALLAPHRCLEIPPEILGTIFQLVMLDRPPAIRSMLQLQRICLVCREWRNVALATPSLWVELKVFGNNPPPGYTIRVHKIKEWFARSGGIPKSLSLNIPVGHATTCPLHAPDFVDLLTTGPVLRELSLGCRSMACLSGLITLINDTRPTDDSSWNSLSKLTLHGTGDWGIRDATNLPIQVLPRLPTTLSTLCISLPAYDNLPSDLFSRLEPLSVASLRVLEIECDWPALWVLETMAACSNVETAQLSFRGSGVDYGDGSRDGRDLPKSMIPNLRNLRLRQLLSRHACDTGILALMICPSIVELDISFKNKWESKGRLQDDPTMEDSGLARHISQFIAQSKCAESLHHFRLHGLKIDGTGLFTVLEALGSSVTHLTLEDLDVDPDICRLMQDLLVLPRLEILEFVDFPLTFDEYDFGELVSVRSPAEMSGKGPRKRIQNYRTPGGAKCVPLKRAVLSHRTKAPSCLSPSWFEVLKEEGVDSSMDLIWGA